MDREDSKKVKQTDPDVNVVLLSDPGQGNKDVSRLSLKRQQGKDSASTSTKKRKTIQRNPTPRCMFCGEYHPGGVLED